MKGTDKRVEILTFHRILSDERQRMGHKTPSGISIDRDG
jgi:hypothetical protein